VLQGIEVAHVQAQRAQGAEVRAELGIDPGTIVIGTVANLRVQKAYPDLLEAAREVIERRPDVRFVAVGQGPLEAEIRAMHARLGLGDRLLLLGHRPDAVRVMGACDVFVLASHWEGLGVAVMEALALGLPVVATAVGGVPEVVEHGREGLLVPPGHPGELAAALLAVVSDDRLRREMSAAAARRGAALSIDAAVRRTEAVYYELAVAAPGR
jgi:glycosyltransferase involved in cell wall biosynthesis